MTYDRYQVLASMEGTRSRKNLITCYIFLGISVLFYLIFFFWQKELPMFGVAFLCDLAAAVYIVRAIKTMFPYWQVSLANAFLDKQDKDTYYRLCASLEFPAKKCTYNQKTRALFEKALDKRTTVPGLTKEDLALLPDILERWAEYK